MGNVMSHVIGTISSRAVPEDSLLHAATQHPGAYADCFEAAVPLNATVEAAFARFVFVFFDTWVFRAELKILRFAGKAPPDQCDRLSLAKGQTDRIAAWIVEARTPTEVLLRVPETPIRTWLALDAYGDTAHLRFGSGIMPMEGKDAPHWGFRSTIWAHRAYSKLLLRAAMADWTRGKTLPGAEGSDDIGRLRDP